MLRNNVRDWKVGLVVVALATPLAVEAQQRPSRVPAAPSQAPAVRVNPQTQGPAAQRARPGARVDGRRGDRFDDRYRDDKYRDDRYDDDRYGDDRYRDDRDRDDRYRDRRYEERYRGGRVGLGRIDVGFRYDRRDGRLFDVRRGQWIRVRFDRDPLRHRGGFLGARDLRRILGNRTVQALAYEAGVRRDHLHGRVLRFGPRGQWVTLEVWTGRRFVAALTDFDRDRRVDDIYVVPVWR